MKIFKSKEQSLFPKPFAVADTYYLAVGVLVFFALDDPDNLLTEQELWDTVPQQLGKQPVLDHGVPKPRGEVLVTGECCAPQHKPAQAVDVSLQAGNIRKDLQVFGDRHWKAGTITDPTPFKRMPVSWERAFGGPQFATNPLGKGAAKITAADGSTYLPLPNIENPRRLIGSPQDTPTPAGFAPLDMLWPQRYRKCGTYDQQWLQKHWPFFPEDMDFEFFNAAPEDQFADGFFQGGEQIQITNMHPQYAVVRSHLPNIRMRVFASLNPDFRQHVFPSFQLPSQQMGAHEEFREISTRLETLWLFPNILRGVAIFRGSTPVLDEEYADVLRLFVATESLDDAPKSLQWYLEEQKRVLNRAVQMDTASFEKAAQTYAQGQRKVRNIPKQLDAMRKSFLGQTPSMPAREPEDVLTQHKGLIAALRHTVDGQEKMAKDLMTKLGPFSAVDLDVFSRKRASLDRMESTAESTVKHLGQTKSKLLATKKDLHKQHKAARDKLQNQLAAKPETAHLQLPPDKEGDVKPLFHRQGFPLLVTWRRYLADHDQPKAALKKLGLEGGTRKRNWLGYNPEAMEIDAGAWGADPGRTILPAGFVLPRFQGKELTGLLIRPWTPAHGDRPASLARADNDVSAPGSDAQPLFLPSATLIDLPALPAQESAPLIRVGDPFQALLLEQELGDFCSIIAMTDATATPGKKAAEQLQKAQPAIIVLPVATDKDSAMPRWKAVMPAAVPLTLKYGASVFEDVAQGEDIRSRILELLPPEDAAKHTISLSQPGAKKTSGKGSSMRLPFPDLGAIIPGLIAEIRAVYQAKFDPLKADTQLQQDKALAKAKEVAGRTPGLNPDDIQMHPPGERSPLSQKAKDIGTGVRQHIAQLKANNLLSPEKEQELNAQAGLADSMAARAETLESKQAAKQKEMEQGLQQLKARQLPGGKGPPEQYPSLTREDVCQRHAQGRSLAKTRLQGVDLSGLDLTGADFSNCVLTGTIFTKAKLDRSTFHRVLARGADFSHASLSGATLDKGGFNTAQFAQANLSGAQCRQVAFSGADLTGADLQNANLYLCSMEKATADKAVFAHTRFELCLLPSSAQEADFRAANLTKCVFKATALQGALFSGAVLDRTLFQGATGTNVDFSHANLDRVRSMKNSQLPGANFTGASLRRAGLRDTDFSDAVFTDCNLGEAILERCRLIRVDMYHLKAIRTRFWKCDLEAANLRGANLFMASLRKSRLVQTDLTGSNLYAVDFYKAVTGNTVFKGANLTRSMLEKRTDLLDDPEREKR